MSTGAMKLGLARDHVTLDVPARSEPNHAAVWSNLWSFFQGWRLARRRGRSAEVAAFLKFAESRIGRPILGATDLDDLDDRLEAAVASDDLALLDQLALGVMPALQPPRDDGTPPSTLHAAIADKLGGAAGMRFLALAPQVDALVAGQQALFAALDQRSIEFAANHLLRSRGVIADTGTPVEISLAVFHAHRSDVCLLAILMAVEGSRLLEPWLALALVERLAESLQQRLRFLASLPGVAIAAALVPNEARIDLVAAFAQHERAERGIAQLFRNARDGGPAVANK